MGAVAYAGKNFVGFKVLAGLVGGPGREGGGAARTPENFRKFAKKLLKKIENWEFFEKILKIFDENSIEK